MNGIGTKRENEREKEKERVGNRSMENSVNGSLRYPGWFLEAGKA